MAERVLELFVSCDTNCDGTIPHDRFVELLNDIEVDLGVGLVNVLMDFHKYPGQVDYRRFIDWLFTESPVSCANLAPEPSPIQSDVGDPVLNMAAAAFAHAKAASEARVVGDRLSAIAALRNVNLSLGRLQQAVQIALGELEPQALPSSRSGYLVPLEDIVKPVGRSWKAEWTQLNVEHHLLQAKCECDTAWVMTNETVEQSIAKNEQSIMYDVAHGWPRADAEVLNLLQVRRAPMTRA